MYSNIVKEVAQLKRINLVFAIYVFISLYNNHMSTKQFIFVNMKDINTVKDCIAYKFAANCGVSETNKTKKMCVRVYKGCLLFSFKIHKLNYNDYNHGIRNFQTPLPLRLCLFALLLQSEAKEKAHIPPYLPKCTSAIHWHKGIICLCVQSSSSHFGSWISMGS